MANPSWNKKILAVALFTVIISALFGYSIVSIAVMIMVILLRIEEQPQDQAVHDG